MGLCAATVLPGWPGMLMLMRLIVYPWCGLLRADDIRSSGLYRKGALGCLTPGYAGRIDVLCSRVACWGSCRALNLGFESWCIAGKVLNLFPSA